MNVPSLVAIAALVDYNWADEEDDYWIECSDDPDDNQRSGHIFESIRQIQDWLEDEYRLPHRKRRTEADYARHSRR